MPADNVIHPHHYNTTKYEAWDVLDEWFANDPLLWQAGKYMARALHKGNAVQDLEKAKNYIDRRINQLKSANAENPQKVLDFENANVKFDEPVVTISNSAGPDYPLGDDFINRYGSRY